MDKNGKIKQGEPSWWAKFSFLSFRKELTVRGTIF